ncbi:MAG: hypothetical protein E2O49_02715 [Gammaproteobacteria bacterium]|nr:MAG: hypothetical protein E2O49_02715 [Gammaproteobacteria bacterium]
MDWQQFVMNLDYLNPDSVEEIFARHGAHAVTLTDDLLESLSVEQLPSHHIESLADREWTREWLKDFASMRFGERLWICPSGSSAEIQGKFDIVGANILAGPLVELVESVTTRLSSGGKLALSGILSEQVEAIHDAYAPWIVFNEPAYQSKGKQNWARLSGKRREN